MSQKTYTGDITKYTDWGGDSSTHGLPVAGSSVQSFIKDTLQDKIGYIVQDREHNKCLGFADSSDYELYIADPIQYSYLIIQEWYCYFPPIPVTLYYPAYYGSVENEIPIESAPTYMEQLYNSNSIEVRCPSDNPYVYVALYEEYKLSSAITLNNEDMLEDFENVGMFEFNNVNYKLYKFHLSSGLSLDVDINIIFSKN